ncbi:MULTISPECIES: hypothetical protein [Mycobacterium]|jgi:hypothetical protein|uniref:Uncharacterized protein n=1 Tax=Mycobacterium gordonae TaxID=1778 RepID=A0A1A6BIM5_MYCGO|nr:MULTISPECIES: hypothetical protein [Mycobacterium]MBI2701204.1 hypothetical protein [Mycobacterium sp.]MBX9978891.1 hypothetical protein [Mycobacterium gordonae]MCQ4359879.1 hypothetical protein [Mycobacterium gordonae]MCV7007070.1 hypothetical protein [Mycobacterium gordonae]OBS02178.1 hypothetical protein A9W98_16120 [Mycobacterium gordonae]
MNIVPAGIQAQINRVDRQWSLWIGVSLALVAAGSVFRLFWMLYISMAFGVFAGAMIVNIVFSLAFGAAAAIGAVGFLTRYHKDTEAERL